MKQLMKLLGVFILSIGVLAACSDSEDSDQGGNGNSDTEETDTDNGDNSQSSEDEGDSSEPASTNDNNKGNDDSDQGNDGSKGNNDNQVDLQIGDTGSVGSTIGKYETTLASVEIKKQLGGEESHFDQFVVATLSIKNVGDKKLKAQEVIESYELTEDLKGSGTPDDADLYEGIEPLEGEIEPGDSIKGEAVFDAHDADKYYLIDGKHMDESGAGVQNKLRWTFKASEAK